MSKSMTATQKAAKPAIMDSIHALLNHDATNPAYKKQYAQNTSKNQLQIKLHGLVLARLTIDSLKGLRDLVKIHNGKRVIEDDTLSFYFDIA